jgi:hypothetical protein
VQVPACAVLAGLAGCLGPCTSRPSRTRVASSMNVASMCEASAAVAVLLHGDVVVVEWDWNGSDKANSVPTQHASTAVLCT